MSLASKFTKLRQFALLDRDQREYVRMLKERKALDRSHYRRVHARLPALFRWLPERHYVAFGEALGLSPRPDFVPYTYLRWNDLNTGAQAQPFAHFLALPVDNNCITSDEMLDEAFPMPPAPAPSSASVAIVLHLYFLELWPEFRRALDHVDVEFDLFVTLTDEPQAAHSVQTTILDDVPGASVTVLPNRGRDILPFVHLVNAGVLERYELVCKMHGKKSGHRADGDLWRGSLVQGLLPTASVARLLERFGAASTAMIVTSRGSVRRDRGAWGHNKARAQQLLSQANLPGQEGLAPFPAGSMFWCKQPVLSWLKELALMPADFEPELGQLDGTTAHAVERLMGVAAQRAVAPNSDAVIDVELLWDQANERA